MARGVDFRNPGLESTRPLRACVYVSIRQKFRNVHATGYRSGKLKKGLTMQYKKKGVNVIMLKDKEYEYISSA